MVDKISQANGHIVQSNWAQNDPSQIDYIHNKPGATEKKVFEHIATIAVPINLNDHSWPNESDTGTNKRYPHIISFTEDSSGKQFEITDFFIKVTGGIYYGTIRFGVNGSSKSYYNCFGNSTIASFTGTTSSPCKAPRRWQLNYKNFGEGLGGIITYPTGTVAVTTAYPNGNDIQHYSICIPPKTSEENYGYNSFNQIHLAVVIPNTSIQWGNVFIGGSVFELWGVRKK